VRHDYPDDINEMLRIVEHASRVSFGTITITPEPNTKLTGGLPAKKD
jgi:hypothetical protein